MIIYTVEVHDYEELFIAYVTLSKDTALYVAKEIATVERKRDHQNGSVVVIERETDKQFYHIVEEDGYEEDGTKWTNEKYDGGKLVLRIRTRKGTYENEKEE